MFPQAEGSPEQMKEANKSVVEDETEIRESGPLESQAPKESTGKIETVASANSASQLSKHNT